MKNLNSLILKLSVICVLCIASNEAKALNPYSYYITTLNQTYTNLSGSTVVSTANWDYITLTTTIPIGFSFPFFDQVFNGSVTLTPSDLGFGVVGASNYFIYPFSCMNMKSIGSGLSPISYILTGTAGNRILKVEWKNVGVDLTTEYFNVQAWLYENGIVEYHFGPNTLSASTVSISGIGVIKISTAMEALLLTGSSTSPTIVNDIQFLSNAPANGTVYRFTPSTMDEKNTLTQHVSLYPNPTTGQVTVSAPNVTDIEVYNLLGEKVLSSTETSIDLSAQADGIYLVKVQAGDAVYTEKVLKK